MKMLTVNSRAIRANHRNGNDALPTLRIYPDTTRGEFLEVHAVHWEGRSAMRFTHVAAGGSGVPGAHTVEVSIKTTGRVRGFDRQGGLVVDLPCDPGGELELAP